ncbi:acyl-CoA N-acyltransferase [Peniophora sp. CONT]|nr:acyl-CoA N-acyltransferase [Peniophora sp. CONT]
MVTTPRTQAALTTPSLFQSARLTYRGFRDSDFNEWFEAWNEPEIQEGGNPIVKPSDEGSIKAKIKTWSETWALCLVVTDTNTEEFVGWVALSWARPRDGELGMFVKRSQWGKGYGTEMCSWVVQHAFNFLDAHRVSLVVFESNKRALSLYQRVGFVQEGVRRHARFAHGRWEDVINMGILDKDFFDKGGERT